MVPSTARYNSLPAFVAIEVGHLVVSPPELEAKDGLLVLSLEQHPTFKSIR
jgi:hypothetical protein